MQAAFVAQAAVSPSAARPLADFPPIAPERLAALLDRGVIREGAPGTYYLYERRPPPFAVRRFVMTLLFWVLLILIPVAIIKLTSRP